MRVVELIGKLGGRLVVGDAERELTAVADSAAADGRCLVFAEGSGQVARALASQAGAVVVGLQAERCIAGVNSDEASQAAGMCVVEAKNPRLWFARAARVMAERRRMTERVPGQGIHPAATIGAGAELGEGVTIAAGAVIGEGVRMGARSRVEAGVVLGDGVQIGEDCRIHPRVTIYSGTRVGDRAVIQAGAVLGADGFGYVRDGETGAYTQFPQQGTLVIEDDVEIGANSTIDRGALGETRIGRGTKIDNLVHIGHNCRIGEDVIIVALTGISGSSTVGRGAVIAGQVGIGDHVEIGEGVILGGQAGVLSGKTLTNEGHRPGTVFWGTPARPLRQVLREMATLGRLVAGRRGEQAERKD